MAMLRRSGLLSARKAGKGPRRASLRLETLEERLVPTGCSSVQLSIIDPLPVFEGDQGLTDLTFTVIRSGDSAEALSVGYATEDGTAIDGFDYLGTFDYLYFEPFQTSATIDIPIIGNEFVDSDRFFTVRLFEPAFEGEREGGFEEEIEIINDTAFGTILDDDASGTVTFTGNQQAGAVLLLPTLNQPFTAMVASFTIDFQASTEEFAAFINWGDGTFSLGDITANGYQFTVTGSHTYTAETTFLLDVTVINPFRNIVATTVPSAAVVLTSSQNGQLQDVGFVRTAPGATSATAQATGVNASLTQPNGDGRSLTLFVARYFDNPETDQVQGADFYDVRVTGADVLGQLTVTFSFSGDPGNAQLLFYDPALGQYLPVQGSKINPISYFVDPISKTITVTFDASSFPQLIALKGTVFAIGVPRGGNSLTPAVAIAASRDSSSSAFTASPISFRSRSQLTISLTASQDSAASGKTRLLKRYAKEQEEQAGDEKQPVPEAVREILQQLQDALNGPAGFWLKLLLFQASTMTPKSDPSTSALPAQEQFETEELDAVFAEPELPQIETVAQQEELSPWFLLGLGGVVYGGIDRKKRRAHQTSSLLTW